MRLLSLALVVLAAVPTVANAAMYLDATAKRNTWVCEEYYVISLVVQAEQAGTDWQTDWTRYHCAPIHKGEHVTMQMLGGGFDLFITRWGRGYMIQDDLNIDIHSGKPYRP